MTSQSGGLIGFSYLTIVRVRLNLDTLHNFLTCFMMHEDQFLVLWLLVAYR